MHVRTRPPKTHLACESELCPGVALDVLSPTSMIKTVAELLGAFLEREREVLDAHSITHGPTIGAMYEGLTKEALSRTLPVDDLTVTSGFARDEEGTLSPQLDCILAVGKGEEVPHTRTYVHRVEDVIATVEVKKTLYGVDLHDGFENLRNLAQLQLAPGTPVPRVAARAFHAITGIAAEREADVPEQWKILWHLLRVEAASPARILLGFHGYKSEITVRRGVLNWLQTVPKKAGYGPLALPHLIASPNAVVLKMNGLPWSKPLTGGKWHLLVSSDTFAPAHALLDVIWSRLNYRGFVDTDIFGDDMDREHVHQLVNATCLSEGWQYEVSSATVPEELRNIPSARWEPVELTREQWTLLRLLERDGKIDIRTLPTDWPSRASVERELLELQQHGLVLSDGDRNTFELVVGVETAFLPDGRVVGADNSSNRLTRWVMAETSNSERE